MPRVARGKVMKIDRYPWFEWSENLEWEDDEFEDRKCGTCEERADRYARRTESEGENEFGFV